MAGKLVALPVPSPAAGLVFGTVLTRGPLSRVEVGRRTGLSPAAVTRAVALLLANGYLTDLGFPEEVSKPGRDRAMTARRRGDPAADTYAEGRR